MRHPASKTLGYQLMHVARLQRSRTARLLDSFKLFPGQEQVLEALRGHDSLSMSELADLLRVRPPTASKTAARLTAAGMVTRHSGEGDARIVRVALTPLGRERAEAIAQLGQAVEDEITAHLDSKDRKRLRKLLSRVEKGLRRAIEADAGPDGAIPTDDAEPELPAS